MKVFDILLEKYLGDLYHYTTISAAIGIIQSNRFKTTPFMANKKEHEYSNDKYFYGSFTRSKHGTFHQPALNSENLILFVFDGDKISNNFKTSPLDYWQDYITKNGHDDDEMEERIYTNKSYIENISRYIKHVDIVIHRKKLSEIIYINFLRLCESRHIKTRIYHEINDFYRNRNFISGEEILKKQETIEQPDIDLAPQDISNDSRIFNAQFLYNLLLDKDMSNVVKSDSQKTFYDVLTGGNMEKPTNNSFVAEFVQRTFTDNYTSPYISKIVDFLRTKRIKTVQGFIDILIEKYNKTRSN